VASAPGGMGLPQLVHVTRVRVVAFSTISISSKDVTVLIVKLPYILYVLNSVKAYGGLANLLSNLFV
jgi:hypothetical protein